MMIVRGADWRDRADGERGRGAPGTKGRAESDALAKGSCSNCAGTGRLFDGPLIRRLAPRGGSPAACPGSSGTEGGGDGPLDQVAASPGSSDILLICDRITLPPMGGGGITVTSDGLGLADRDDSGEKGLG